MKTPTALFAALATVLLVGGLSACGGEPEVTATAPVRGERLTVTEALIDAVKPA